MAKRLAVFPHCKVKRLALLGHAVRVLARQVSGITYYGITVTVHSINEAYNELKSWTAPLG
jgi:hypothetical protein